MPSPGDLLGHYQILSEVGRGGMGAVFQARDTRLGREVAVKASAEQFSERFEREARVIASLNHPNICTLFDVGPNYLVMELIEGESPRGPLPLETVIDYARQMADALDYAHERGITHRDLKPANLKITPDGKLKVLDFGLAKVGASSNSADIENSPTLTMGMTEAGMILGTAAYMAPEQAKGKTVDKRADIWAFGVVLYELSTGKRPFEGEDITELLASVLRDEPKLEGLPERLRPLIARCLQKDPRKRLRDMGDVQELLNPSSSMIAAPVITTAPPPKPYLWMGAAAVLAVGLGIALWAPWRSSGTGPVEVTRLNVDLGPEAISGSADTFAISPDGRRIVYTVRNPDGQTQLATRLLDSNTETRLSGTANGVDPMFSASGQELAYFAGGKLKRVSIAGGAPVEIADTLLGYGGAWRSDGLIVLSSGPVGGLVTTQASGGAVTPLTKLSGAAITHRWPSLSSKGDLVIYTSSTTVSSLAGAELWLQPLPSGDPKLLVRGAYHGRFVEFEGKEYVVYVRDGALYASAFDAGKRELSGPTLPVIEDLAGDPSTGAGHFDVAGNGTLLYRAGRENEEKWPALLMDKTGATKPLIQEPALYITPRFSPDGKKLALSGRGTSGLAIYDLERGTVNRFPNAGYPAWSLDGKYLAIRDNSPPNIGIGWIRADGGGQRQKIYSTGNNMSSYAFTPDGKALIIMEQHPQTNTDVMLLPLDLSDPEHPKAGTPKPLVQTDARESYPSLSKDGKWLAYASSETGRSEIYVIPYPGPGGRWQISTEGGNFPLWSPDGKSLYFVDQQNKIEVADLAAKSDAIEASRPRLWSQTPIRIAGDNLSYAIHPDGQRFLVYPAPEPSPEEKGNAHVTFVFHFLDDMQRRLAAAK